MGVKYEIKGVRENASLFRKVADSLGNIVDKEVYEATAELMGDARRDAPVDTGELRNSIRLHKVAPAHYYVEAEAEHSVFVHDGTRYMPPRPFLIGKNSKKAEQKVREKVGIAIVGRF